MSTDASPHSQVRHVLSPTTTELVIDGAVYSVDGIKQLIGRELTRTHLINGTTYTAETLQRALDVYYNSGNKSGPPADAVGVDAEPEPEATREEIAERVREDLHALQMHQVVPVVTAYLALDDALRSLKGSTVSVDGLPKTARGDDEPDR